MNNHLRLKTSSARQIPIALSLLSAGRAVEITDDHDLLDLNFAITGGREGFVAFPVTGDSMVDEIRPGHIVFVDTFREAQNGDIVVSCVNGRNNIKKFEKRPTGLYLVPKNRSFQTTQVLESDDFHILGVVRGHMRIY